MRVCLFSAHSPSTGGGAVILKSLVNALPNANIEWIYVAKNAASGYEAGYIGSSFMGGNIIADIVKTFKMLAGKRVKEIDEIVKRLLQVDCDAYWVVSHNEGIRVALELANAQKKIPVHLTIHDDWAGALCARSFRYRLMSAEANNMTIKAIKAVSSFDVISKGMQEYYLKMTDRKGQICHRFLSLNQTIKGIGVSSEGSKDLHIGHIGSLYSEKMFLNFCKNLHEFTILRGLNLKIHVWGHQFSNPNLNLDYITIYKTSNEEFVVKELAICNFVYCMYPFEKRFRIFSKTSLPTKLSTYVLAGRPILGHGPKESSLAEFLAATETGIMLCENDKEDTFKAFDAILSLSVTDITWLTAIEKYFGQKNLNVMDTIFSNAHSGRLS
ncbi:hypothetical protein [Parasediminibacterium sp. JCM 36343]|uniref:hypothetical protein n=1 Tax=Parasediminibacterium sp. JCM 36343 TaxID=3374279 RepID=UPI00397C064E